MAGGVVAAAVGIVVVLAGFKQLPPDEDHDHEPVPVVAAAPTDALDPKADSTVREAWYRANLDQPAALDAVAESEPDESLRLLIATGLARAGDAHGLTLLAALAKSETPFLRLEADDRLRDVAGSSAPVYDPLSAPDTGAWMTWVATAPPGWEVAAKDLQLP